MKNTLETVGINILAGLMFVGVVGVGAGVFTGIQCASHASGGHRTVLMAPVCEAMGIEKGVITNAVVDHVKGNLDQIGK